MTDHRQGSLGPCAVCGGEWPCRDSLLGEVAGLHEARIIAARTIRDESERAAEAERQLEQTRQTLREAVTTIDRWDANIGQPPDPPDATDLLIETRDRLRALAAAPPDTSTPT